MKTKTLIIGILLALPMAAQQRFSASTGNAVLSGTATALTIQQPATTANPSPNTVTLESAVVYCSVACVVSQAQNGTAATATAATIAPISPVGSTAVATAWSASNVGGGTAVPPIINVSAGNTITIDLSKVTLPKGGSTVNYTVSIASITGTANITMIWKESAQ